MDTDSDHHLSNSAFDVMSRENSGFNHQHELDEWYRRDAVGRYATCIQDWKKETKELSDMKRKLRALTTAVSRKKESIRIFYSQATTKNTDRSDNLLRKPYNSRANTRQRDASSYDCSESQKRDNDTDSLDRLERKLESLRHPV
jgi:hypothetical protein